jgi:hypothetical protein
MFEVTQTALEDDRYDVLSDQAKWFMFSARVVQEKRAAIPFNNGFTSETSPDGVRSSTARTRSRAAGTARNILSTDGGSVVDEPPAGAGGLAAGNQVRGGAVHDARRGPDPVVPPELEFTAAKIVNSTLQPGIGDNDLNTIRTLRNITVVKNVYLTDTDAWFLLAGNKSHGFTSYTRVPMSMDAAMTDPYTRNRLYPVRFRQSWGVQVVAERLWNRGRVTEGVTHNSAHRDGGGVRSRAA